MTDPILPDTYFCVECFIEVEAQDATHNDAGHHVCNWCRPEYEDGFFCEGECNKKFLFTGIPVKCPTCGSPVAHAYEDTCGLILQKQLELAELMAKEPLQTPSIIARMSQ